VQGEQSFFWDAYVETIDSILVPAVEAIEPVARHALWLETDGGWDWHYDHKDEVGTLIYNADDIVIYLRNQLLTAAGNFENSAIRRYRER